METELPLEHVNVFLNFCTVRLSYTFSGMNSEQNSGTACIGFQAVMAGVAKMITFCILHYLMS
jgi:hypothetical protein